MTALTLGIPGVYVQPRPRVQAPRRVRTDVAGLIGFEPRVTPATAALDTVRDTHRVSVRLVTFHVDVAGRVARVEGGELVLSAGNGAPLADDERRVYTVAAARPTARGEPDDRRPPPAFPVVVAGAPSAGVPLAPDDTAVRAAVHAAHPPPPPPPPPPTEPAPPPPVTPWSRVADVQLRRAGDVLWLTVAPRLTSTVCEDWRDFVLQFGAEPHDGTRLAAAARAYFANGGDRCHIATVRRPLPEDDEQLAVARREMVGDFDASAAAATGLARLLLIEEVALVAAPDLHALRPGEEEVVVPLPPSADEGEFQPCRAEPPGDADARGTITFGDPVYGDLEEIFETEEALLRGVVDHGLGVELVITPPLHRDAGTGRHRPPDSEEARAWAGRFLDAFPTDRERAFAACYWPWLHVVETVGVEPHPEPPLGAVLGLVARRDLVRTPFVAPANEIVEAVVAPTEVVDDETHRRLYDPSTFEGMLVGGAVNVLRPGPGGGVELWGSRTLAEDRWLRHLPVRRGLSSIERQAAAALDEVVFEPNTPMLWMRVTNLVVNILLPLVEAGLLRESKPQDAFYVRCDESLNPPDWVDTGHLLCEVGVALAAPAEFLVFRLGRRDAAIELTEVT